MKNEGSPPIAPVASRGRLIVVGGHSRNVGKTSLIVRLLPFLGGNEWIAVKISNHRHAPNHTGDSVVEEFNRDGLSPTARYLRAGARRSFLRRAADDEMRSSAEWIAELLRLGHNMIVESNRIVDHISCDLVFFVVAPAIGDWKASSAACLSKADAVVLSGSGCLPDHARDCCTRMTETFSVRFDEATPVGLTDWIRNRIPVHDGVCVPGAGCGKTKTSSYAL